MVDASENGQQAATLGMHDGHGHISSMSDHACLGLAKSQVRFGFGATRARPGWLK